MTGFEIASVAVNVFVLGLAVWIIKSGGAQDREERKGMRSDLKRLLECLHKLEVKLTSCVTWTDLEKLGLKVDVLDSRVDAHETRITVMEKRG